MMQDLFFEKALQTLVGSLEHGGLSTNMSWARPCTCTTTWGEDLLTAYLIYRGGRGWCARMPSNLSKALLRRVGGSERDSTLTSVGHDKPISRKGHVRAAKWWNHNCMREFPWKRNACATDQVERFVFMSKLKRVEPWSEDQWTLPDYQSDLTSKGD